MYFLKLKFKELQFGVSSIKFYSKSVSDEKVKDAVSHAIYLKIFG